MQFIYSLYSLIHYHKFGKNEKQILEKSVQVLDFISDQLGQFTTRDCTH